MKTAAFLALWGFAASFLSAQVLVSTGGASGARLYYPGGNDWWIDPSQGRFDLRVNGGASPIFKIDSSGGVTGSSHTLTGAGAAFDLTTSSGVHILSGKLKLEAGAWIEYGDGSSAASSSGGTSGTGSCASQAFTANGTWTRPAGVTQVLVSMVGGGGGGGGAANGASGGGGGGGGAGQSRMLYPVSVSGDVSVVIGTAGAAGVVNASAAGTGGDTYFGSVIAMGGKGGSGAVGTGSPGGASGGGCSGGATGGAPPNTGAVSTSDGLTYCGGGGGAGSASASYGGANGGGAGSFSGGTGGSGAANGGGGGASTFGPGGPGGSNAATASPSATAYGAGGGGGGSNNGTTLYTGAAGNAGYVLVQCGGGATLSSADAFTSTVTIGPIVWSSTANYSSLLKNGWTVVASTNPSNAAAVCVYGLSGSYRNKVYFNLTQVGSNGMPYLQFNADGTAGHHKWHTHYMCTTDGQLYSNSDTQMQLFSTNLITAGSEYAGSFEIFVDQSNGNNATTEGMMSIDADQGGDGFCTWMHAGKYSGSAAVSSFCLYPSAGTYTGQIYVEAQARGNQ